MAERVPPGRAGRLWLHGRIAAAQRNADLLDRKRTLLQLERARLAEAAAQTRHRWEAACGDSERWGLRAAVLGGASDVALAAEVVAGRADVEVRWHNTMGVRHPEVVRTQAATLPSADAAAANAALAPAAAAYRRALAAAAEHAAANMSLRVIEDELRATQRRQRAIEHHRLPALTEALTRLELHLDELERDERVVARWAQRRRHQASPAPRAAPGSDSS